MATNKNSFKMNISVEQKDGTLKDNILTFKKYDEEDNKMEEESYYGRKLYYMEVDKNKEYLEIHEAKNIRDLSSKLKISGGDLKEYLHGNDEMIKKLDCGITMPFIKRNRKMYMISYYKDYLELKNTPYISKKIVKDISYMNSFKQGYEGSFNNENY